ncbi:hypothetical protein [Streptomyces sp. NPDC048606]|uniref:hypothetical protein n=1 Tax=Streptomyces sp. NPDC048606 TaxID=3154726 RepID=UPI00343A1486
MDYGKLDAALSLAVDAEGRDPAARDLSVLVRLTQRPSPEQWQRLRGAGVEGADGEGPDRTVLTGTLSRRDVESLSAEPWVHSLSLSGSRRPTR